MSSPEAPQATSLVKYRSLKIGLAAFFLGPIFGYWAFFLFASVQSAVEHKFVNAANSLAAVLMPISLVFLPMIYLVALKPALYAAVLAPVSDSLVSSSISRRLLGLVLGGVCAWIGYVPITASFPPGQLQERESLTLAGAIAGFAVAWICQRCGWTKSPSRQPDSITSSPL